MCVILIAETERLTPKIIDQAIDANGDGNGMAWRKRGKVHWSKGLTRQECKDLAARLPLPYIFHARIATIGGVLASLTHPFPVDPPKHPWILKGKTERGVIFHNGHWADHDEWIPNQPKNEPWSDTKAMAEMIRRWGLEALDDKVISGWNKVVWFLPKTIIRHGIGWKDIKKGIVASNDHFLDSWRGHYEGIGYYSRATMARGTGRSMPGKPSGHITLDPNDWELTDGANGKFYRWKGAKRAIATVETPTHNPPAGRARWIGNKDGTITRIDADGISSAVESIQKSANDPRDETVGSVTVSTPNGIQPRLALVQRMDASPELADRPLRRADDGITKQARILTPDADDELRRLEREDTRMRMDAIARFWGEGRGASTFD